jgi:hypothetical protein
VKRSVVNPATVWTWSRRRSRACCAGVRWYLKPSVSTTRTQAGPVEVDPEAVEVSTCSRGGESRLPDQSKEPALELGVRETEHLTIKKAAEGRNSALPGHLTEGVAESNGINQAELVCFVDRGFQLRLV